MKFSFCAQVCQMVPMPVNHLPVGSTMSTVHLSSDGTYFYWVWSPASLHEKTPKGHSVFMDVFELVVSFTSCLPSCLCRDISICFLFILVYKGPKKLGVCAVCSPLPQIGFSLGPL